MTKGSVLIVDDDPGMTETLADILGDEGYEVDTAGDGRRAIDKVTKRPYDAVLMDIRIPGMDGVEALKEIKRLGAPSRVMMMAFTRDELVNEAMAEGACGVTYKPLDLQRVLAFVEGGGG